MIWIDNQALNRFRHPNHPRTFETIPADVRAEFERQKIMLVGMRARPLTEEEFAEYYWEQWFGKVGQ